VSVPRDDQPFTAASNVNFGKSPLVVHLTSLNAACTLQPARYDSGMVVNVDAELRRFITLKLDLAGSQNGDRTLLIQNHHISHRHYQIVRAKLLQRIGVSTHISVVPNLLEPRKLSDVGCIVSLRNRRLNQS